MTAITHPRIRPAFATTLVLLGLLSGALAVSLQAQPADADWERGMPPMADEDMGMGGPPSHGHPLLMLIDTDRDGVVSAAEINGVSDLLRAMDTNRDGELSEQELVEALPPPPGRGKGRRGERGMGPPPGNDF